MQPNFPLLFDILDALEQSTAQFICESYHAIHTLQKTETMQPFLSTLAGRLLAVLIVMTGCADNKAFHRLDELSTIDFSVH